MYILFVPMQRLEARVVCNTKRLERKRLKIIYQNDLNIRLSTNQIMLMVSVILRNLYYKGFMSIH